MNAIINRKRDKVMYPTHRVWVLGEIKRSEAYYYWVDVEEYTVDANPIHT